MSLRALTLVLAGLAPALAQNAPPPVPAPRLSPAQIKQFAALVPNKIVPPAPCLCLKDLVDHCKQTTGKKWYYLNYTLSITANSGLVSYTEGALTWDGVANRFQHVITAGDTPYFNNTRDTQGHPFRFNPAQQKMKVTINANCIANIQLGAGPITNVPLQCGNFIYYGFVPAHGDAYMLSLKKAEMDIPQ